MATRDMIIPQLAQLLIIFTLILVPVGTVLAEEVLDNTCVCAVEDAPMYKVAGYEHHIVQYLLANTCVFTSGNTTTVYGSYWCKLNVSSMPLWTSGDYLAKGKVKNDVCGLP